MSTFSMGFLYLEKVSRRNNASVSLKKDLKIGLLQPKDADRDVENGEEIEDEESTSSVKSKK